MNDRFRLLVLPSMFLAAIPVLFAGLSGCGPYTPCADPIYARHYPTECGDR